MAMTPAEIDAPSPLATPSRWWLAGLASLVLAATGAGLIWLRIRPKPLKQDTKKFRDALDLWLPVVFEETPTPRAVKRFVNRVRFLATMARPAAEATELLFPPEDLLVMLCAIQHARPGWIDSDEFWNTPLALFERPLDGRPVIARSDDPTQPWAALRGALNQWGNITSYRTGFRTLVTTDVAIR